MKVLLVAVNAKYIHTNLAVHYLRSYAADYRENIHIAEYTINHQDEDILSGIYKEQADIVAFSCYIWNMDIIKRIIEELKQVQPEIILWMGGPEVSYHPKECLEAMTEADGIIVGEGEQTFLELMEYYIRGNRTLERINGIVYRTKEQPEGQAKKDHIRETPGRKPLSMDQIPFPYEDMEKFRNKIIYYESSRGCPYSCSYCLSSVEHGVRLRSMNLVKQELKSFLDHNVAQIKFVDRTFNCNRRHTMELWRFIKENDNGVTNFHFEITADLLNNEEIELLSTLRPGQVQLEIGVQSTYLPTMEAIRRKVDFKKLSERVLRIKKGNNVHQHLDLIAGLPFEDYQAFSRSFDDVYRLGPDQLQLGFLKILKGSSMELESEKYGIVYRKSPPYEVLSTNYLSYGDILKLKGICSMVEVYYNSGQFVHTIRHLEHYYDTPFLLYQDLSFYYEEKGLHMIAHTRLRRYEILLDFYRHIVLQYTESDKEGELSRNEDQIRQFSEILMFDLCLREGIKNRPAFAGESMDVKLLHRIKSAYGNDRKMIHVEGFHYDVVKAAETGRVIPREYYLVFDYTQRDVIRNEGKYVEINLQES